MAVVIPRNRTSLVSYSPLKEEEEEGDGKLASGQSEVDDDDDVGVPADQLRSSEDRQVRLGTELGEGRVCMYVGRPQWLGKEFRVVESYCTGLGFITSHGLHEYEVKK